MGGKRPGVQVATVRGLAVRVSAGGLLLGFLLMLSLSGGLLPEAVPDQSESAYLAAALVGATLLLASLLGHELAHALVARRAGVPVTEVTLWLLGGVAHLEREAPDPRAALRIALVGPLTSLGLAAVAGVLALALEFASVAPLLAVVMFWVAGLNAVIAVFNLLPGIPLDGGRALQAWLWRRSGDRQRATAQAAGVGLVVGLTLAALGLLEIALLGRPWGLWTVLIGGFLALGAAGERRVAAARGRLAGLTVADAMIPDPLVLPAWTTVADLAQRLPLPQPAVPLVSWGGDLAGLLHVPAVAAVPAEQAAEVRLDRLAVPAGLVPTARPDDPLADLVPRLVPPSGWAVVVAEGRVVGLVSAQGLGQAVALADMLRRNRRAGIAAER